MISNSLITNVKNGENRRASLTNTTAVKKKNDSGRGSLFLRGDREVITAEEAANKKINDVDESAVAVADFFPIDHSKVKYTRSLDHIEVRRNESLPAIQLVEEGDRTSISHCIIN